MALISCPECNKEVSDKVKACPHCGFPFIEETNKVDITSVSIAQNMKKKQKSKILTTLVFIVLIVILSVSATIFFKYTNEKRAVASESIATSKVVADYEFNLDTAITKMYSSCEIMERITDDVQSGWSTAISNNIDFNEAIAQYYQLSDVQTDLSTLSDNDTTITALMKLLNNPPTEYERVYDELLVLYDAYQGLYNQAKVPSGTLATYSSDVNDKIDAFVTSCKKINTLMP